MVTFVLNSEHARALFFVSFPMSIGIGNYLGPFLISPDQPEGQEQGGGTEGGQG